MPHYELFLADDRGRRLMPLNNLHSFSASKVINTMGAFSGVLRAPTNTAQVQNYHYIERGIRRDWQVQVWRKARGPLALWNSYFVLKWGWTQDSQGEEVFSLGGYDQNHLLTRRIVAAYAASSEAEMTDQADDMMKAVVTDSMEDTADPTPTAGTRAWGDLSVAGDQANGPSLTLKFAWRKLLTLSGGGVLSQIARAAREKGTEVFFWIVPAPISTASVTYQFRTYTGQPGRDLTSGRGMVTFSAEDGTLANWALGYDYSEEENYIYGLGSSVEDSRIIKQVYDEARYKASYWARCEGTRDARNQDTDDGVEDAAYEELSEGRPRITLSGKPVSTFKQTFGRHYDVGDRVIAKAKSKQFDALVWSAAVGVREDGAAFENVRLEYRP